MLLTDEKLFLEELDTENSVLSEICESYREGRCAEAKTALVAYFKQIVKKTLADGGVCTLRAEKKDNRMNIEKLRWADEIVDGWVSACGYRHHFENGQIDWSANPTYNAYKEWTWQLSRHPEFGTLAYAYIETGNEKYAKRFDEMISSWLLQAVCPEHVSGFATQQWRTIEAGIRFGGVWNLAIAAFLSSPSVSDDTWLSIIKSIWEHGYRLSTCSTSHNWLIMEMNGLIHIALLYPFFKKNAEWHRFAEDTLAGELDGQLYPDGFQYELSTGYHWVVLYNYLGFADLYRNLGIAFPEKLRLQMLEMAYMFTKLSTPSLRTPGLNDGGDGYYRNYLISTLRIAPNDPTLLYFTTDGKEGVGYDFTSYAFPWAGMSVSRTGWGKNDIWAFFESAPFGKAHQHEDKLSFLLSAYGKDLLTDTGTYEYDTSDMRQFVLSTRSHNTALVDFEGQNRRDGYRWNPEDIKKPSDLSWEYTDDFDVAEGEYDDGYGKEHIPVTHKRKMIFFKKGLAEAKPFFVLLDTFTPHDENEHFYEILFQLGREAISVKEHTVTVDHGDGVTLSLISSAYPEIKIAQKRPRFMGWRPDRSTREEHEHFPAPAVLFLANGKECRVATVVYPNNAPSLPIEGIKLSERGFTIIMNDKTQYAFEENDARFATRSSIEHIENDK